MMLAGQVICVMIILGVNISQAWARSCWNDCVDLRNNILAGITAVVLGGATLGIRSLAFSYITRLLDFEDTLPERQELVPSPKTARRIRSKAALADLEDNE